MYILLLIRMILNYRNTNGVISNDLLLNVCN